MSNDTQNPSDFPREHNHYRTGDTHLRKSHRSGLAVFLVLVIFFSGVATACKLLNIHLFHGFGEAAPAAASLRFSKGLSDAEASSTGNQPQPAKQEEQGVSGYPRLGITVQQLSPFEALYYHLPSVLYVTKVAADTDAAAKGLTPGDILISLDGQQLTDIDTLQQLLSDHNAGDQVSLVIYRSGKQHKLKLTLRESK